MTTHRRTHGRGSDPRRFEVIDGTPLGVLWVVLPMLGAIALVLVAQQDSAPARWAGVAWASPQAASLWSVAVLCVMAAALGAAFFRRRVTFDGHVLDVRSTLFRRRVPVADMQLEQAGVMDVKRHPCLALKRRRLGYSVPGFHSGHYVLNDGRKGFALLTDRQRTLVIPLKDGSVVMLSMAEPKALLAALRTAAAAG